MATFQLASSLKYTSQMGGMPFRWEGLPGVAGTGVHFLQECGGSGALGEIERAATGFVGRVVEFVLVARGFAGRHLENALGRFGGFWADTGGDECAAKRDGRDVLR